MNDAQAGLVIATLIIIIFAVALRRMGALRTGGAIAAITLSIIIATVLFFSQ
jgi:hypothetical protein